MFSKPALSCVFIPLVLIAPAYAQESQKPATLPEAVQELKRTLPPEMIQKIQTFSVNQVVRFHSSLGVWIRNEWGLWQGRPLRDYFYRFEIYHPDSMSGCILKALWCDLHHVKFDIQKEIRKIKAYWRTYEWKKHLHCPKDSSDIYVKKASIWDPHKKKKIQIFAGYCKKNHHHIAYRPDRGFYGPTDNP